MTTHDVAGAILSVTSARPRGNGIGSSNCRDQPRGYSLTALPFLSSSLGRRHRRFGVALKKMPSGRRASNRARFVLRRLSGSLRRSSPSSASTSKA